MNKYEIMYVVRPTLEEAATKSLIQEIAEIFPKFDSKVVEAKELGLKELAYEIQKHKKGFYVLLNVEATADAVNEFNRIAKIKEDIVRYIVLSA